MPDNDREQNRGCLFAILDLIMGKGMPAAALEALPYHVRDDFLSPAEVSFYHVLSAAVRNQAKVCAKVALGDIFFVSRGKGKTSNENRIARKHVDFLLCDAKTMKPLAAMELDDASHRRSDREERDKFVDKAFQAAGLPLLHIKAQRDYNAKDLAAQILPLLTGVKSPPTDDIGSRVKLSPLPPANTDAKAMPLCPKCGVPMVPRTASRGQNQGQSFYGCPNFPKCREMVRTSPP